MNKSIINLFKASILTIISLFISSIFINILYYFDIINNNLINYLEIFLSIFVFFFGGIYIGRKSDHKGYINGLKLSLIIIIMTMLLNIIFDNFKLLKIVYYLIITISITFGSMIGISKTKNNSN